MTSLGCLQGTGVACCASIQPWPYVSQKIGRKGSVLPLEESREEYDNDHSTGKYKYCSDYFSVYTVIIYAGSYNDKLT